MSARRVAMVTGGARAVGKAVTLRLARDFDTVVVNHFRSPADAQETAEELQRLGVEALVVRGSVARPEQRDRMFAEVADAVGHLDLLVNCAADGGLVPFDEVTEELLDKAFATDLKGSLGCARAAAELMQGRRGAIVNVSTLGGGQLVMANYFACAPAKAAVEALTRYLAVEFAPRGIRVNTAVAGMLRSPVAGQFPQAEQMQRAVADATPMGRLGNPEELAEVVAFLGSDAASWVTGQTVVADGGLSTGAVMLSPPRQESRPAATPEPPVVAATDIPAASMAQSPASPRPSSPSEDEIVVVATGLVVPGANDPEEFWRDLLHGADRMIPIPAERWDNELFWTADGKAEDKTYSRHSGFITDFRPDPGLLAELEAGLDGNTELTTLWLRHCLHQVLRQTALRAGDACSLVIGYTADGSQHLEEATVRAAMEARMPRALQAAGVPEAERRQWLGRVEEVLARRYHRGVGTPHHYLPHQVGTRAMAGLLPDGTELLVVDTACSSSLYSVDLAIKGLREGRHDVAVAGGAFAVGPRGSVLFAKLNGLSRRGQVRSLDRDADGVLFSDGAGLVVLKTLSRARADGDRVLATVSGFGSSSDGKGKAIYAPSAAGQRIAIDRAYAAGVPAPDWVIAHATGTPAGDLAEFTTLRTTLGRTALGSPAANDGATPARAVALTSNKSVIGHTGWAAGVASIVHAVKGLEHEQIPPQHQFEGLAASFEADGCGLTVPAEPVPWPAHDGTTRGRRTVAISGFGFGGTNAHLVLSDAPADHDVPALLPPLGKRERLAVVGLTTHLPGAPADGERPALDGVTSSFGETYPAPSLAKVKMPPAMVRAIDRAQLMILECAHAMRERLGDFWTDHQDRTGVVLGHLGATRNAMLYASRCYVDDLDQALRADAGLVAQPWLGAALERLREDVRATCPPSTEDTFPGMMPNVIPARVANYFDLHGLNLTVDTGFTSSLAAVDVAARYLHTGEIDLALVGGINGNDTAEVRSLLRDVLGDAEVAEGAFLLAVTTESRAAVAGIPVLALLEPGAMSGATPGADAAVNPADRAPRVVECGVRRTARSRSYLGAEGARALAEVLLAEPADRDALVVCHGEEGAATMSLRVLPPEAAAVAAAPQAPEAAAVPELRVERHEVRLRPAPSCPRPGSARFWEEARTLVLTDSPQLVAELGVPAGSLVLSVADLGGRRVGPVAVEVLTAPDPDQVRRVLQAHDPNAAVRHVRVVSALAADQAVGQAADQAADRTEPSDRLLALHDLSFLVAQQRATTLREHADLAGGTSWVTLLVGGIADGTPRPAVGLFSGLVKVLSLEKVAADVHLLVTDLREPGEVLALADAERRQRHTMPVVYVEGGQRLELSLAPEVGTLRPPGQPRLTAESVVVAVGGGRGIAAELLQAVAARYRSRIYVLGSNDLEGHPRHLLEASEAEFAVARQPYIAARLAEADKPTPKAAAQEFQRVVQARETRRNLAALRAHSGADRVHYLRCDVTDEADVAAAFERIRGESDGIDLLLFVAGLNRSAPVEAKDFGEFRRIRDLKVLGHRNLARALAGSPPRYWCNFGSLLGMTGQAGETDYASGNDYLGTAALARHRPGHVETTIGWTLWGETGLGTNALTKAYFEKSGLYSQMSSAEGVHHFLRELELEHPVPYTVHLGESERAAVDRLVPGFLDGTAEPAGREAGFYLDRLVASGADEAVFERTFDPARDGYLAGHLVDGTPTLPGAFVTEIAVEAATALCPGRQAVTVEDLTFHRFLKVHPRGLATRIAARRVATDDAGNIRVEVELRSDAVSPGGVVLVKDRLHFSATVTMAVKPRGRATWAAWDQVGEVSVPDPYHAAASPVLLDGEFRATTDTRLHRDGKRSTYALRLPEDHPVYGRFAVPVLMLDGLLRTGVLDLVDGHLVPVGAPLRIGRIDLFEEVNDPGLAARGVELYAVVPSDGRGNRFVAADRTGRVVLQLHDLEWTRLGHIDVHSGELVREPRADAPRPMAGSLQ